LAGVLQRHFHDNPAPSQELQVIPPPGSPPPPLPPPPPDPVIDTIDAIIRGIRDGVDIKDTYPAIARLIANQEDRNELLNNLVQTNDLMRLPVYMRARKNLENILLACAMRGDLKPHEALELYGLVVPESEKISSRVRAGASTVKDVEALLGRVDYMTQLDDEENRKKLKRDTTPQGREMIRRLVFKLSKLPRDG